MHQMVSVPLISKDKNQHIFSLIGSLLISAVINPINERKAINNNNISIITRRVGKYKIIESKLTTRQLKHKISL
jgi:hypothetical protein